jgi:hypothetical protein
MGKTARRARKATKVMLEEMVRTGKTGKTIKMNMKTKKTIMIETKSINHYTHRYQFLTNKNKTGGII